MRAISIVFRRELAAYLRSPIGYVVAALVLLIDGILFQAMALGGARRLSAEVLRQFFYFASGTTMIAAVALSIRLIAEERQQGTMVLLHTSPIRDVEIVIGKFLSAFAFLAAITLASLYMPLLILVHGKISFAQVLVGYVGLLLLGGTALAIGLFASALTRHQLVAAAVGGTLVGTMVLLYFLAQVLDPPLKQVVGGLDLFNPHFTPFMIGILHLRDVVFYLSVTYFFLLLAVKTMEAKRWQ
jgi:gliding motility-associated transport system permease protein